jgi:hypothetical protein
MAAGPPINNIAAGPRINNLIDRPRGVTQEIVNFLKNSWLAQAHILDLVPMLIQNHISNLPIITSLMSIYAYGRDGANIAQPSLVYYSMRNRKMIAIWLEHRLDLNNLQLTEREKFILTRYSTYETVDDVSTTELLETFEKAGLNRTSNVQIMQADGSYKIEKVINMQFIGADYYMLNNLPNTWADLLGRVDPTNFRLTNLSSIAKNNLLPDANLTAAQRSNLFSKDGNRDIIGYDLELYTTMVYPASMQYKASVRNLRKMIGANFPNHEIQEAYEVAIANMVDYLALAQQMEEIETDKLTIPLLIKMSISSEWQNLMMQRALMFAVNKNIFLNWNDIPQDILDAFFI